MQEQLLTARRHPTSSQTSLAYPLRVHVSKLPSPNAFDASAHPLHPPRVRTQSKPPHRHPPPAGTPPFHARVTPAIKRPADEEASPMPGVPDRLPLSAISVDRRASYPRPLRSTVERGPRRGEHARRTPVSFSRTMAADAADAKAVDPLAGRHAQHRPHACAAGVIRPRARRCREASGVDRRDGRSVAPAPCLSDRTYAQKGWRASADFSPPAASVSRAPAHLQLTLATDEMSQTGAFVHVLYGGNCGKRKPTARARARPGARSPAHGWIRKSSTERRGVARRRSGGWGETGDRWRLRIRRVAGSGGVSEICEGCR